MKISKFNERAKIFQYYRIKDSHTVMNRDGNSQAVNSQWLLTANENRGC